MSSRKDGRKLQILQSCCLPSLLRTPEAPVHAFVSDDCESLGCDNAAVFFFCHKQLAAHQTQLIRIYKDMELLLLLCAAAKSAWEALMRAQSAQECRLKVEPLRIMFKLKRCSFFFFFCKLQYVDRTLCSVDFCYTSRSSVEC